MISIWAKTLDEKNKIFKSEVFKFEGIFTSDNLYDYLLIICDSFKIETPIVLSKHRNHLKDFNSTKFLKEDFVDFIDFKYLIIELISDC